MEDLDLEGNSYDMKSPVRSGMAEVRDISKSLGVNLYLIRIAALLGDHLITQAVQDFLQGTGSLLYFWDRDEALGLVKSVYHLDKDTTPVYTTEVFAMSAVGSYCDGEAHSMVFRYDFLIIFLYMLSSPSYMCDLRCMRLFAWPAICRFTDSVESARRLLCKRPTLFEFACNRLIAEVSALSIRRQTFTSPSFRAENSEEEVRS